MDYTKEDLVKKAIARLDTIDELLEDCQNLISNIKAEKQIARYLFYLACEKEDKKNIPIA